MEVRTADPPRSLSKSSRSGTPSALVASKILELQKTPEGYNKPKCKHQQQQPVSHHQQQSPYHGGGPQHHHQHLHLYQQHQQYPVTSSPQLSTQPQLQPPPAPPTYFQQQQHHHHHQRLSPKQQQTPYQQHPPQYNYYQQPTVSPPEEPLPPRVQAAVEPLKQASPPAPPVVNNKLAGAAELKSQGTAPSRFKRIKMEVTAKIIPYIWPSSPASFITGIATGLLISYIRPALEFYLDIGTKYFATILRFLAIWGTIALIIWSLFKLVQRTSSFAMAIPSATTNQSTTTNNDDKTKSYDPQDTVDDDNASFITASSISSTNNDNHHHGRSSSVVQQPPPLPAHYGTIPGGFQPGDVSPPLNSDVSSIVSSSAVSAYSYGSDQSYDTAHSYRPYENSLGHYRTSSSPSKPRSPAIRQAISSLSMNDDATTTPKSHHHHRHHHSRSPSPTKDRSPSPSKKPMGGRPLSSHSDRTSQSSSSGAIDVISGEAISVLERPAGTQAFRLKQRK